MNRTQWMMAALLSVSTLATLKAQTSSPVKDDLFAGTEIFAKGASDVNEITMDPSTLGMVTGREGHKARGMVLNVVRSYSYDKPGMYNIADVETFRNKLNTGDWHCSVHTRNMKSGESTDICNKQRTDGMKESAIITVEPKELTFIHTITRDDGDHSSAVGASFWPGFFGVDPSSRAEMAIEMAELKAQMAEMRAMAPETMPLLGRLDLPAFTFSTDSSLKGLTDGSLKGLLDNGVRFKIDNEVQKQIDKAQDGLRNLQQNMPDGDVPPAKPKQPE